MLFGKEKGTAAQYIKSINFSKIQKVNSFFS